MRTSIRPNRSTAARSVLGVVQASDVELDGQEIVVGSERGADPLGVASGSYNRMAGGQGGLSDVDAHPAAGASNEPNLLVNHAALSSIAERCGSWFPAAVYLR